MPSSLSFLRLRFRWGTWTSPSSSPAGDSLEVIVNRFQPADEIGQQLAIVVRYEIHLRLAEPTPFLFRPVVQRGQERPEIRISATADAVVQRDGARPGITHEREFEVLGKHFGGYVLVLEIFPGAQVGQPRRPQVRIAVGAQQQWGSTLPVQIDQFQEHVLDAGPPALGDMDEYAPVVVTKHGYNAARIFSSSSQCRATVSIQPGLNTS